MQLTTKRQLLDLYFEYDGRRVLETDKVPYDANKMEFINLIAKTRNMAGDTLTFTAHGQGKSNVLGKLGETKVDSSGLAKITLSSFSLWDNTSIFDMQKSKAQTLYAGIEGFSAKHIKNRTLVLQVGAKWDSADVFDENDPQLVWGDKVSREFRLKVVEISKRIKVDPNWIMTIMAKETGDTFSPKIDNGKGYVGLIQFSEDSARGVGTTQAKLIKMSAVEQLNYVEKRFVNLMKDEGYKSLTDLYMAVLQPSSVGEGDKDMNILWTSKRKAYYSNPSYHKEEGEYDNKIVMGKELKRGFEEGTTYMWEVRKELERIEEKGKEFKNVNFVKGTFDSVLEEMKTLVDTNIPYSQEGVRDSLSEKGLEALDCSELVSIYLYKLGITKNVKNIHTGIMTNEKDFRNAIDSNDISFVSGSDKSDFKPQKGDIFVWRSGNGHTGIVYKYEEKTDLVTILEAIGSVGAREESQQVANGGSSKKGCTRTAIYKRKSEALFKHPGWKGYFRPKK